MPLKLLKRTSDQYNVVSKSTFVISVTLLDNGTMECTLDADSTGRDCLSNISQRLSLHQPEFFGLRYISRGVPPRQRWLELEQPLKKQLDKYAEDTRLSLGVMFYVGDVNLLKDEMTRYHYFLQLKADVIEGKLNCTIDQAICLGAYSLQAEFGDYDTERHTVEYLRDFAILPKDLVVEAREEFNVDAMFDAVARQYGSLLGFPPALGEIYYIMVAQQLEGYGQECYPSKDDSGNDMLLCVSANGVVIRRRDRSHIAGFRWKHIKSFLGHKKSFTLEILQLQCPMPFQFTDPEVVKYVQRICTLQSTFNKANPNLELQSYDYESPRANDSNNWWTHTSSSHLTDSYESPELFNSSVSSPPDLIQTLGAGTLPMTNLKSSQQCNISCFYQNNSLSSCRYHHVVQQPQQLQKDPFRSADSGSRATSPAPVELNLSLSRASLRRFPNSDHEEASVTSPNSTIQPLLPSYRAAPDYDTAVQLKYTRQQEQRHEEPIYQNEIMSKIHSIDLRERDSQVQSLQHSTRPAAALQVAEQPYHVNLCYMKKPKLPYTGTGGIRCEIEPTKVSSQNIVSCSVQMAKPYSSFNAHADVLKQISADIYTDAVESTDASYVYSHKSNSQKPVSALLLKRNMDMRNELSQPIIMVPSRAETDQCSSAFVNTKETSTGNHNRLTTPEPYFCTPIDSNVMKEFQSIQKSKPNPSFTVGMKRENAKRNRTPNVLPYDDNLIHLTPSKQNAGGYINASPVTTRIGDRSWTYIVGQTPLRGHGPCALWQMIWESGTKIIVSLERDSSAPFYPSENNSTVTFGEFQVIDCKTRRPTAKASIARELILSFVPKKKQRRLWLLPYEEEWKHDIPVDTEHFLCFLEEVNSVQRKVSDATTPPQPLAVMCATGAGRSGVFVLSEILLHAADSGHKIRCDHLLSELRSERMLMVTHPQQYAFVLETLAKYLAQSRLI